MKETLRSGADLMTLNNLTVTVSMGYLELTITCGLYTERLGPRSHEKDYVFKGIWTGDQFGLKA